MAVYDNGDVKLKGCFEINKEFHKDPSMKIIPIALKEYFVNKTPIEDTIKNHKNIFDFCLRLKTNSKSNGYYRHINSNGDIEDVKLDRTTRYYISNKGGILIKKFTDDRISGVNVGYTTTLFNKYEEKNMEDYDINYNFYILEAKKIRNAIENYEPLNLFDEWIN